MKRIQRYAVIAVLVVSLCASVSVSAMHKDNTGPQLSRGFRRGSFEPIVGNGRRKEAIMTKQDILRLAAKTLAVRRGEQKQKMLERSGSVAPEDVDEIILGVASDVNVDEKNKNNLVLK